MSDSRSNSSRLRMWLTSLRLRPNCPRVGQHWNPLLSVAFPFNAWSIVIGGPLSTTNTSLPLPTFSNELCYPIRRVSFLIFTTSPLSLSASFPLPRGLVCRRRLPPPFDLLLLLYSSPITPNKLVFLALSLTQTTELTFSSCLALVVARKFQRI